MNSSNPRTRHPSLSFLIFAAFFQGVGGIMGWITSSQVDDWYVHLHRSPLNPPDKAFGIAWSLLYFLLSVSAWLVWKSSNSPHRTMILWLFGGHMILNWLWTPLFFLGHFLYPSYVLILVLIFTAAMTAWLIYPLNRTAALLFIPYIGWLVFAGHLAHFISIKN